MEEAVRMSEPPPDESLLDTTPYGSGKDDSVADVTENAAVTHHTWAANDVSIPYTATAGHLVTTDLYSARPAAKIFYVAFTADGAAATTRPLTFFYNGGPGSSSVFLLLGSFGPRRIKTNMPAFTPPAPYTLEDNQDSLLDHTDLVFINPVGTGYSAAVAPGTNKDFWGVDEDARSIKQFIKRYLTAFNRWNSPKFLFGESYGTPRTSVLTWMLHEDGVDLNGVVLQSSILDYSQACNPVGLLPTLAADAWYHKKVTLSPYPSDLPTFMNAVMEFDREKYAGARAAFALGSGVDPAVLQYLSDILGIAPDVLESWKLDPSIDCGTAFLTSLLQDKGLAVGAYDGRVTATDTGIARSIDPNSGGNDPTITAVGGVYTTMWNVYLNDELRFTATSPFMDLNDQAFENWNFDHVDPTGAHVGGDSLYTAGDLAAAMALNPYLKVFSANGYYDAVTSFFQTILNFDNMPLEDPQARQNLAVRNYPSGHMVYLDNESRAAMKRDLADFYEDTSAPRSALARTASDEQARQIFHSRYRRRFTRTPY
jgi:carboxypeptidase C (cathepsin A)